MEASFAPLQSMFSASHDGGARFKVDVPERHQAEYMAWLALYKGRTFRLVIEPSPGASSETREVPRFR